MCRTEKESVLQEPKITHCSLDAAPNVNETDGDLGLHNRRQLRCQHLKTLTIFEN